LVAIEGEPIIARFATGLRKPSNPVPGTDVAGTVVAVGKGVTSPKVGDQVFGWCTGAFAEYACAREDHFLPKPATLTFEQAAAVGVSATTALQLLRDRAVFGAKVLINGASGGLGSYAVQIATAFGAEVTGVSSGENVDVVRSLGADDVIDYTREDFTDGSRQWDVIIDTAGRRPLRKLRRALTNDGTLAIVGGDGGGNWTGGIGRQMVRAPIVSMFTRQRLVGVTGKEKGEDIETLREMVDAGKLTPLVAKTFALPDAAEAVRLIHQPHAAGKIVVMV